MKMTVPEFWEESPEMKSLFSVLSDKAEALEKASMEMRKELTVTSAVGSLAHYAKMYGVTQREDADNLREEILAKIRGVGVCNKDKLVRLGLSHTCGEISVREIPEAYTVEITFLSELGIPRNMAALKKAIRDAVPAHLDISYVYSYRRWGAVEGRAWEALSQYKWGDILEGEME